MKDKVVAFPGRREAPSAAQLVTRIRKMAGSDRVGFDEPHFRDNLTVRHVNMRQVLETLRKGSPVGEPTLDDWGDWRLKLKRVVAGRRVQVVVAVKADHCVCVTVF
jgi:hypothetical protein